MASADMSAMELDQVVTFQQGLKAAGHYHEGKPGHDLHALRRFLKARKWDMKAAQSMWQSQVQWREQWQADTLLHQKLMNVDQKQHLMRVYPHGLHGVDAMGRPVLWMLLGATDANALKREFSEHLLLQEHIQGFEYIMRVALPSCSIAAQRHVDQVTIVVDLEGLGIWDMAKVKDLLLPTFSVNGDAYPETLAQMIIIRAPPMFDSAFAVIKKMLSPETQQKITILGKNFLPVLARAIPPSQIPKKLGGTSDSELSDSPGPWQDLHHLAMVQPQAPGIPTHGTPARAAAITHSIDGVVWISCRSDADMQWASIATDGKSSWDGLSRTGAGLSPNPAPGVRTSHLRGSERNHAGPSPRGIDMPGEEGNARHSLASFHSCASHPESTSSPAQNSRQPAVISSPFSSTRLRGRRDADHEKGIRAGCLSWLKPHNGYSELQDDPSATHQSMDSCALSDQDSRGTRTGRAAAANSGAAESLLGHKSTRDVKGGVSKLKRMDSQVGCCIIS